MNSKPNRRSFLRGLLGVVATVLAAPKALAGPTCRLEWELGTLGRIHGPKFERRVRSWLSPGPGPGCVSFYTDPPQASRGSLGHSYLEAQRLKREYAPETARFYECLMLKRDPRMHAAEFEWAQPIEGFTSSSHWEVEGS